MSLTHSRPPARQPHAKRHASLMTTLTDACAGDSRRTLVPESTPRQADFSLPQPSHVKPKWPSLISEPAYGGRRSTIMQLWAFSVSFKGRILLVNPLQSSRSTFSRGSLPSFFAFKEGMLGKIQQRDEKSHEQTSFTPSFYQC